MLAVIGQLLPITLAVALSTVPITAVLTILLSPGSGAALPFAIGLVLGILLVTGALALGLRSVPANGSRTATVGFAIAELAVGAALVVYACILFARRRRVKPIDELPGWLRAVGRIRPLPAFGLGVLLAIRPKSLLLSATAGLIIGPAELGVTGFVLILVGYAVLGGSTVALPAILTLARPEKMRGPLGAAEHWSARNSRTVTTLVSLVIGTAVFGAGLANV